MKFLVIPETDPEIQSERRFRNLKEFVANVEARHQVGTAIPEEYIESITHIPEEDMEPLGLADSESELADAEQSTNGKDALSVASIDQLFSEIKNYSQTAEVMLTNAEVAVLAFAYVNGSVAQKSWTSELGDALDVGRNEFQKQVTAFLGIALKKTEDGPYKKTVLMNPDIRVVVDSLIQYRKNESQAPKIPTP